MRPAYTLQAMTRYQRDPQAEGITTVTKTGKYKGESYTYEERTLPELGPKRLYYQGRGLGSTIILPIGNRRFKVKVQSDPDNDDGIPQPGTVTFEETTEPETPFVAWDGKAELEKMIQSAQEDCQRVLDQGFPEEVNRFQRNRIAEMIQNLADEDWDCYLPSVTGAFGQPAFIQNPVFPVYNGRYASHLLTFETGWGDSGNENYMVALDGEGYPVAVFHEASCA